MPSLKHYIKSLTPAISILILASSSIATTSKAASFLVTGFLSVKRTNSFVFNFALISVLGKQSSKFVDVPLVS